MKLPAMILSCTVLSGAWASAQTDPFLRSSPVQVKPALRSPAAQAKETQTKVTQARVAQVRPAPATQPTSPGVPAAGKLQPARAPAPPTTLNLTNTQSAVFGNPRLSGDASVTKLVFDLPVGMTYALVPTFGGLRIDVGGARVVAAAATNLAPQLSEYRAGGGQVTLGTAYPLSLTDGWRASETAVTGGGRVLIVELGSGLRGGAAASVRGRVLAAAPLSPEAQQSLRPPAGAQDTANLSGLPPGDSVRPVPGVLPPAPPAPLPGSDTTRPSDLVGTVPGTLGAGSTVTVPRIGKNPGLTRLVLDLPPGTGYRIVPNALGLRVELLGVSLEGVKAAAQDVSPEVRAWRYEATAQGVNLTIVTGAPTTSRSGWRGLLLPPVEGAERSRLALDLSPALANLTPLPARERVIAGVPPIPATRGTALLALAASSVRPRIVLDAGHGGKDPGAVGSVIEKEVTLAVAQRVRDLLVPAGVDVVLTRESDRALHPDKTTDLNMRAQLGTPGTQLFVSIHVNALAAASATKGYGIETWWNPNHALSYDLAATLQRDMVRLTGAFDRGVKGYHSLAVLRGSRIPAALVEIGFTSHPVDGQNLLDTNYLDRVAVGIATGIRAALVGGLTAAGASASAPVATGK